MRHDDGPLSFPPTLFLVEFLEDLWPGDKAAARRIGYNYDPVVDNQDLEVMTNIVGGEVCWDFLNCHCILATERGLIISDPESQRAVVIGGGSLTRIVTLSTSLNIGGSASAVVAGASSAILVQSWSTGKVWTAGTKLHVTWHPRTGAWFAGASPAIT